MEWRACSWRIAWQNRPASVAFNDDEANDFQLATWPCGRWQASRVFEQGIESRQARSERHVPRLRRLPPLTAITARVIRMNGSPRLRSGPTTCGPLIHVQFVDDAIANAPPVTN